MAAKAALLALLLLASSLASHAAFEAAHTPLKGRVFAARVPRKYFVVQGSQTEFQFHSAFLFNVQIAGGAGGSGARGSCRCRHRLHTSACATLPCSLCRLWRHR